MSYPKHKADDIGYTRREMFGWGTAAAIAFTASWFGGDHKLFLDSSLVPVHETDTTDREMPGGWFPARRTWAGWKEDFIACSKPGPRLRRFLSTFRGTPAECLALSYTWLSQNFTYITPKYSKGDTMITVENFLALAAPVGNCVQIAAFVASCGLALGFSSRVLATRAEPPRVGHVQTQIFFESLHSRELLAMWKTWNREDPLQPATLPVEPEKSGGIWLSMDGGLPPARVALTPVEARLLLKP